MFLDRARHRDERHICPSNFVVTLPKIQIARRDVDALVDAFELLEDRLDLAAGALRLEIMVETTQTIFDPQGRVD